MSTINPDNDLFLVQRNSNSYQVSAENLMSTINYESEPYDYMLIQRDGASYKVSAKDVKDQLGGSDVGSVVITKGIITPSTDVKAGDTLTGTATYAGNVEPTVFYHKWYVDGVQDTSATTNTFEAVEGSVTYQLCITDPNNTTPVEGGLSDAVTVSPATKPNADMHGLRFDHNRQTKMYRAADAAIETYTFSTWFKWTKNGSHSFIFSKGDNNDGLRIGASGEVGVYDSSGLTDSNLSVTENIWAHIVLKVTAKVVELYVNGIKAAISKTLSTVGPANEPISIGYFSTSDNNITNGYMSDVYFVDGQALPPETFGKEFDLGWGPLDSSVVKANIGSVESPYDSRPNYDQKWSDLLSVKGADPTLAFDGDLATRGRGIDAANNGEITWQLDTTFENVTSLRIRMVMRNSETIIVNGTESYFENQGNDAVWVDFPSSDLPSTVTSIAVAADVATTPSIYAIEVNGRLLIDGPADNSQVWSDQASASSEQASPSAEGTIKNFFDGDTSTVFVDGFNTTMDLSALNLSGQLELYIDSSNKPVLVAVNGETIGTYSHSGAKWITIGTFDAIDTIYQKRTADGSTPLNNYWRAMKVDGLLIADAPDPPWDTSQVWSDNVDTESFSIEPNRGPDKGFDGDLSTSCAVTAFNDIYYINLKDDSFKNQTVEIYTSNPDATVDRYISLNGVSVNVPSGSARWLQIGAAADDGTATIGIGSNSASKRTVFYAIRIGGEILVDAGSFGTNGFYLPFDPEATGEYWSDGLSCPNGFSSTATPSKAFDGSLTTAAVSSSASQAITFATSDFTSGPYTVAVYADNKHTVTVDGAATVKDGGTGTIAHRLPGTVNSFSSIVITPVTSLRSDVAGIEVNGEILVDYNSIGTDDSGNGNHFHDQNFIVGNTSQVWSELITGSPLDPKKAFNGKIAGNYADGCMPTAVNESCSIDFGDTFESADSVKLYFIRLQDVCELSVNGSSVTTQFDGSAINVFTETVDVSGTGLNTIFWNYVPSNGAPAYSYVSLLGIEVDGELLIDANIGIDTVTDTPMRNYAVWGGTNGENGNLRINNLSPNTTDAFTVNFGSRSKVYFETIKDNTTQDACAGVKVAGQAGVCFVRGDGVLSGDALLVSGTTLTFSRGDVVGCAVDVENNTFTLHVDGVQGGTYSSKGAVPDFSLASPMANSGDGNIQTVNFGQQPFAASNVTYDQETGIVTLPDTSPNTSEIWSDGASGAFKDAGRNATKAFDGKQSTGAEPNDNATVTFDFTSFGGGIDVNDELKLFTAFSGTPQAEHFTVNGFNYGTSIPNEGYIVIPNVTKLETITMFHNSGFSSVELHQVVVDGRVLIDDDPNINDSQVWSDTVVNASPLAGDEGPGYYAFDNNFVTQWIANIDGNPSTWTYSGTDLTGPITIFCRGYGSQLKYGDFRVNGVSQSPVQGSPHWHTVTGVTGPLTSITINRNNSISTGTQIYAVGVNGKVLVDKTPVFTGGTYNTLFQTWEQQYATYYKAKVAAADVLIAGLRAHAQTYSPGTDYCEGSVIKAFGELWIAINNSPSTTFADLPALMTHPNWEKLGISA